MKIPGCAVGVHVQGLPADMVSCHSRKNKLNALKMTELLVLFMLAHCHGLLGRELSHR